MLFLLKAMGGDESAIFRFGKWVRKEKTQSLAELAKLTGIQPSNLSALLKKDDISHQHLIKLCRALNHNLYFKAAIELSKYMLMDARISQEQQIAAGEKLQEIDKAVHAFHVLLSGKEPHFVEETNTMYLQNKVFDVAEEKKLETKWEKDFGPLSKLKRNTPEKP